MTNALFRSCAVLALAALPISARAGGIEYTITDLGEVQAIGINAEGHVTGQDLVTNQAFIYNGSTVTDFGGPFSRGDAINSSDEIAGYDASSGSGFIYSSGSGVTLIGGVALGGSYGINNSGEAVGTSVDPSTTDVEAFSYDAGSTTYFTSLGADSLANGINDSGQIAGTAHFSGHLDAYIYNPDGSIEDLGAPAGATDSTGTSINASGEVAGYASYSTGNQAFLWNGTTMVGLGTLGGDISAAAGLNDHGQVVGAAEIASGSQHAFIYSNGVMTDLNSLIDPASGWLLTNAAGINDAGQIIAVGFNASGQYGSVLLTPLITVPLPAALPAGLGLFGLVAIAWRRRSLR